MTFNDIAWLPLCGGLTGVGIVLSYLAFRRRGAAAGLRATAWSLLPLAAYLTGALSTLWNVGAALVGFVTGLVLSPAVWAGVVLAGLSVLLFFASGALRGRALSRARKGGAPQGDADTAGTARGTATGGVAGAATGRRPGREGAKPAGGNPAPRPVERAKEPAAADDFSDIEDILKRRGIS
ncbi:cellulose synthase [Microbispora sp. NPDC049125]|uniref:cellulose synthase n=1 Tax=Microbispora sp. NPDC049125 TaxID=3154929 RepID=UPI00346510B0